MAELIVPGPVTGPAGIVEEKTSPPTPPTGASTPPATDTAAQASTPAAPPASEDDKTPESRPDENREWARRSYGAAVAGILESAGLDGRSLNEQWHTTGALPEEAYAKLEGQGVSRAVVDQWLAGVSRTEAAQGKEAELNERERQARDEAAAREVFSAVGGRDVYQRMAAWAHANLSPQEQDAYNDIMNSGNLSAINFAVAGLESRYRKALGADPRLVSGGAGAEDLAVYRSSAEVTEAMRDPRYKTDPAYRRDVVARLLRSDIFKGRA